MIRILLVDDQNLVQQGIKVLLDRDSEIKVVGTVRDGRSALMAVEKLRPDIVLLDIEMPRMDGITATKYITHLAPKTKVIILSSHEDRKYLTRALMAGAKSYILKDSLFTDLKQAIISVNNGYSQIESRLLAKIFDPSSVKQTKKNTSVVTNHSSHTYVANSLPKQKDPVSVSVAAANHDSAVEAIAPAEDIVVEGVKRTTKTPIAAKLPKPNDEVEIISTVRPDKAAVPKINLSHLVPPRSTEFSNSRHISENRNQETYERSLTTTIVSSKAPLARLPKQKKLLLLALSAKTYLTQLPEHPQVLRYRVRTTKFLSAQRVKIRPLIEQSQQKLARLQSQVIPMLKQWYFKGWLANLGWIIVGLLTVIIIHRLLS
ncbi:MAG: response regulator transcription factor [Cyanobacteria bacterium J06623_7]